MAQAKLTESYLESLPFTDSGQKIVWDVTTPGFGVRVSTRSKQFIAERRLRGGPTKRRTIGPWPAIKVAQAKVDALQIIGSLARGIDPKERETESKLRGVTLKSLFNDYLDARARLKPKTRRDYEAILSRVFNHWAEKPWTSITSHSVMKVHRQVSAEHGPAYANLAFRVIRAVLAYGINVYRLPDDRPLMVENPVSVLTRTSGWNKVTPRTAHIPVEKLKPWLDAVDQLESRDAAHAMKLMLFTGLRLSEALSARWENIDFAAGKMLIPETKNGKPHTIPLSKPVAEILATRKGANVSGYVFPGKVPGQRLFDLKRPVQEVCRKSGLEFSPHALRRSFAMFAEQVGESDTSIKRLLNHSVEGDVTATHYRPLQFEGMRRAMDKVAALVLRAAGRASEEVVVQLSQVA